jgi:hypothetical protein
MVNALQRQLQLAEAEKSRHEEHIDHLKTSQATDRQALDVAQDLMQDVAKTENKYRQTVQENRKLKAEIKEMHDSGFLEQVDKLQDHWKKSVLLLQRCAEEMSEGKDGGNMNNQDGGKNSQSQELLLDAISDLLNAGTGQE